MSCRIIFLVSARGGSHLLGRLLAGDDVLNLEEPLDNYQVPTIPSGLCPLYTPGHPENRDILFRRPIETPFDLFIDYIADGFVEYKLQSLEVGMEWNADQISYVTNLSDECVFFQLIRDGRNQIASLKFLEESPRWDTVWDQDRFKSMAYAFRWRAQKVLEKEDLFSNFHILKFEDLVSDITGVLDKIKLLTGLSLDYSKIYEAIDKIHPNSSYWNVGDIFDKEATSFRWKGLTTSERRIFHEIAGSELLQLGYIDNNNWIEEK